MQNKESDLHYDNLMSSSFAPLLLPALLPFSPSFLS